MPERLSDTALSLIGHHPDVDGEVLAIAGGCDPVTRVDPEGKAWWDALAKQERVRR
jgi:hypothetical protein